MKSIYHLRVASGEYIHKVPINAVTGEVVRGMVKGHPRETQSDAKCIP